MTTTPADVVPLDIAVGVLIDASGRWLVARRRRDTPGAGYWEFPGGKIEAGESVVDALARELLEEIGVTVTTSTPLIRFSHARGPRPVRLHVHRVTDWAGTARGCEGQSLDWVSRARLDRLELLPASDVIVNAASLPRYLIITPADDPADWTQWLARAESMMTRQTPLLRLRAPALDDAAYAVHAEPVIARAQRFGCRVLLDRDAAMLEALGADGLHWPAARLRDYGERPISRDRLLGVSAHDDDDLALAARTRADFATLSPVKTSATHPRTAPMGWPRWTAARDEHDVCVYALGGLGPSDWPDAAAGNAQGIAGIRGFID